MRNFLSTTDCPEKDLDAIGVPDPLIAGRTALVLGAAEDIHDAATYPAWRHGNWWRAFSNPAKSGLALPCRRLTILSMNLRTLILGGAMAGLAVPAFAHPHVFIDTKVEVILGDQNRAISVRISWTYDDLYSLYVIGDMGLDPDWDGKLTPEEEAKLSGFDMEWIPGFQGDTYALQSNRELALSPPTEWSASYAGGKITTTHLRTFDTPVPVGTEPLIVQVYDPGFYTAYSVDADPLVTGGAGCVADAYGPDLDQADEALKAALAEYSADVDLEADFPAVGKNYAEEVRVTCAAPS